VQFSFTSWWKPEIMLKCFIFFDKSVMIELKILGTTEQKLFAQASRHPGFVDF
jgi:hypothetical protein